MALVFSPRFVTQFLSPKRRHSSFTPSVQRTRLRRASFAVKIDMSLGTRTVLESVVAESTKGPAILWYKHDLRIDDHPGLLAASQHRSLVPLYVFDHRILSRLSNEMLELLLFALDDLRKSLKEQGSNLMIRLGNAESVIEEIVKEVKAASIYTEDEVEYELHEMLDAVNGISTLTSAAVSSAKECPRMVVWRTPFYDIKNLEDLPASYDDFKKLKLSVVSPILPPQLPVPEANLTWGTLPTLDDLKKFMHDSYGTSKNKLISIKNVLVRNLLQNDQFVSQSTTVGGLREVPASRSNENVLSNEITQRKRPARSAFVTQQGNLVGGGTSTVLNALAAYLRYLEGTARDEWQEVHEKLRERESREGASFSALFGSALLFGIISRRRVQYEAIKYEKERNAGFLSPFGYSAITVAAAVNTVSSMEYTVAGHEGPAVLLVHGFGAFLDHYRDNISHIAEGGNRVWAITLLGFGRSEKPNVIYTELVWAKLVRDFVIEVVGEPVHLVGNSIGGYCVAIAAGLWPTLAKSVVLLNSAGNVVPEYSTVRYSEDRQISWAVQLVAKLLLLYLRSNIRNILKDFYPSKTERADDWLINEMLRTSHDPGVLAVLECIFSFDLSVPLNYLLEGFERKVLVIQGMRDPVSDSRSKLSMLKAHCKGIVTREIDAGHCPHDEQPTEVNLIIQEWVDTVEREASSTRYKSIGEGGKAEFSTPA